MKQLFREMLKAFLIFNSALLCLALVFSLLLFLGRPWWVGFPVLIGLAAGIVFLKNLFLRKREQRFIHQVIHQEEAYALTLSDMDKERSQELQFRWKEAVEALRNTHPKKMGNPLHVLPWFLVIGESSSGKTTSIKSARLSSPFTESSRASGISGFRNCDWWFFEQAIIIETSGRHTISVDQDRDRKEWQKFLSLLITFRKREPLNGFIITVAADRLLSAPPETLEADGLGIRQRLDELMQVLGAKLPVYVLVTKCDLVHGMTQFCERLPEKALDQAMGFLNHDFSSGIASFNDRAMHTISERLKEIRLQLLNQPGFGKPGPAFLLFPEEFEKLKTGLSVFTRSAFRESTSQETPILRGMFFSSGRQKGIPYSHFLKSIGLIGEREVLPGTSKGVFLFDFFSRILPDDRSLFSPKIQSVGWSRLTRNPGLTAWVAIVIALCGLLSFSFVNNLRILKAFSHEFASPPALQGEMVSDVILMDRYRESILRMEDRNRTWWIPRFGLNESREVETRLKQAYCKQFEENLLSAYDKRMTEQMTGFTGSTPDQVLCRYLVHMIRRINLLKGRLGGEVPATLRMRPQPDFETFSPDLNQPLTPEIQDRLEHLYQYDLLWQRNPDRVNREITYLQDWVKQLLAVKQNDLSCFIAMVNADPSVTGVTLADFWGGDSIRKDVAIPPAYTLKGKNAIDAYIKELETALDDPLVTTAMNQEFQKNYKKNYLDAWEAFGSQVPSGIQQLAGKKDWLQVIDRIALGQDPYFSFLARLKNETAPFAENSDHAWVGLVIKLEAARQDDAGQFESGLEAATALRNYREALAELSKAAVSEKGIFEIAAKTFAGESAGPQSPFFAAEKSVRALEISIQNGVSPSNMFRDLVSGPRQFLWDFYCRETACYLDRLWQEKVLARIEGITNPEEISARILGEKGAAMDFLKGPVAPFIDRNLKRGFFAKSVMGREIDFKADFLSYFTKVTHDIRAARAEKAMAEKAIAAGRDSSANEAPSEFSQRVTITGMPTDVNPEAAARPYATHLELQCADKSTQLNNLNYPVRKIFDWSSRTCGDVVFTIEIGAMVLTKKYVGILGFPTFLSDFGNGEKRWYPKDFPENEAALKHERIRYIQVNYQIEGGAPIVAFYKKALMAQKAEKELPPAKAPDIPKVPRNAALCWDQ